MKKLLIVAALSLAPFAANVTLQAGKLGHAFKRPSRPPHESAASILAILANRTRR